MTAGLGGMGGAQPLAVTMNEGCALCIEVDLQRIERRIRERYLDERAGSLDDALTRLAAAQREGRALSIGLLGNAAEILPELVARGAAVDVVTDQTSAHDPLNGYVPAGLTPEQADVLRASDPDDYLARVGQSVLAHVDAIRTLGKQGAEAFDYGNALRGVAQDHGDADAFAYPGFVPAYIRPLFCEGKGPFRWVALSGDPADIAATDRAILDLFGDQEHIRRWIELAGERVAFQGLPARICWLGYGERHLAGLRFNAMVASGELKAPVVIGRDHLDAGSVASPQRETEAMRDGSDAVADWPILNALVNTATGASWVSFHHGGGVGMGLSLHAGQVTVADGTELAGERIRRTLIADPGMGIVRHVDAGYDEAIEAADRLGVRIPMRATMTSPPAADDPPRRRAGPPLPRGGAAVPAPRPRGRADARAGRRRARRRRRGDRRVGCAVLPGLVDCHTHLPFAGWRAEEYERKVTGVPYEEIARAGGGIASSGRALAEASDAQVLDQAEALAAELLRHGTTAFEGKTGYGFSRAGEARAVRLGPELAARVVQPMTRTGLFAHAVPPGHTADTWMDEAEALARESDVEALDIFVESVAFGVGHLARMGALARELGLPLRAHVEQLSTMRSVPVALEWGARSVDHLSVIHPDDVAPLAASETAAVLLPGAELMNAEATAPGPRARRRRRDLRARHRLQPRHVADRLAPGDRRPRRAALRLERARGAARRDPERRLRPRPVRELGSLEPGKRADAIVLDGPAEHVPYRFGHNPVAAVVAGGELAWVRPDHAWRVRS